MDEPRPDLLPSHDDLTNVELEDALVQRAPRRQRLTRAALVLAALVIALGALLRGALPLPDWSLAAGPTPASRGHVGAASTWTLQVRTGSGAPGTPGSVNIYSNVSYGTVTLNGGRLNGSPPLSVPALAPGLNTLTLDAAPFPRVSCTIYSVGDSGEGGTGYQTRNPCTADGFSNRTDIYIFLTGDTLPPTAAARALSTLRAAVSQLPGEYATVPAGEYYATGITSSGTITYARANVPLDAQLDFAAYTDGATGGAAGRGAPCVELQCGGTTFTDPVGAPAWLVSEPLLLRMRFQTRDGTPMGTLTLPGAVAQPFALAYRADGTWQTVNLGAPYLQPVENQCGTGYGLLAAQLLAAHGGATSGGFAATADSLAGCQMTAGVAGGSAGSFIWRFGVLLAADATAHALLPALPIAPPSAVQALATPTPATLAP